MSASPRGALAGRLEDAHRASDLDGDQGLRGLGARWSAAAGRPVRAWFGPRHPPLGDRGLRGPPLATMACMGRATGRVFRSCADFIYYFGMTSAPGQWWRHRRPLALPARWLHPLPCRSGRPMSRIAIRSGRLDAVRSCIHATVEPQLVEGVCGCSHFLPLGHRRGPGLVHSLRPCMVFSDMRRRANGCGM